MAILDPPPLASPIVQDNGTATPPWGRWLSLLQSLITSPGLPYALCNVSTGPTLTSGTANLINFATVEKDTDGAVSTGAAWKFTVPSGKGGLYAIKANAGGVATASETLMLSLYKNGAELKRASRFVTSSTAGTYAYVHGSWDIWLASGDYVDIRLYVDSSMTLEANTGTNWVSVACLQMDGS